MEERTTPEGNKNKGQKITYIGAMASKMLFVLSITGLVLSFIINNFHLPYRIYICGIVIAIACFLMFSMIRKNSHKPKLNFDERSLQNKNPQLSLLLQKIYHDIARFEGAASYNFGGVKSYKYATMVLAGLSTILLGLDLKGLPIPSIEYSPNLAKNTAFVIGAIITGYSGMMTYWNIEKYWLQNKSIAHKLSGLKDEIENLDKKGTITETQIQEKFDKYQTVKNQFYKYWEGAFSSKGSQTGG